MTRVLVAEPSAPISAALRKFLHGVAEVQIAHFLDEAVQLLRARPPDVVIAAVSGTFDGETLCAQVRKLAPTTAVILVYPAEDDKAAQRALEQGADSFLVVPLKKPAVLATVQVVLKVRTLRERIAELEEVPVVQGKAASATGFNTGDEAFFKKFLLLEIKRSKRYRYPVSLLVVSLDALSEQVTQEKAPDLARASIRAEVLTALATLIREVDLAVVFGDDKYLLFLPHTAREGAQNVADRVLKTLAKSPAYKSGKASIGIACHDPKHTSPKATVSYGALLRDATTALKKAQTAGGNRSEMTPAAVPAKRNRISIG